MPFPAMLIHKIDSKERCQSYFIYGCRRIKIEEVNLSCAQAPIGVDFLYFCMARSYNIIIFAHFTSLARSYTLPVVSPMTFGRRTAFCTFSTTRAVSPLLNATSVPTG